MDSDERVALIFLGHELPSGDLQELIRRLHRYSKLNLHPQLDHFLRQCALVLKSEVQKLPQPLRQHVPPFHDVMTLASYWDEIKKSPVAGAFEAAFLCLYEIAMLIGHFESHRVQYRTPRCLVGVSVGLFAAAAVSVSESLSDLCCYGAESVRVALAFSIHVHQISQTLENTETPSADSISWASVVLGISADSIEQELARFNHPKDSEDSGSRARPLTDLSVSHVDNISVGITGPPSRLKDLFKQSDLLRNSRHSTLPISGGLCHTQGVYDEDDVLAIIKSAKVRERWGDRVARVPLISPFTGLPFPISKADQLVEAICIEALTKPLFFDKLSGAVATQLESTKDSSKSSRILHYRATVMSDSIIAEALGQLPNTAIRRECLVDWVMRDDEFENSHNEPIPPRNAKLAIVGMSCRMPGGADNPEKFWDMLVNGVDAHTTIPADRFDLEAHFDPTMEKKNSIGTKYGNFIDNPGFFDAGFFNMSPREAEQTDPMQRLALVTAYEALEMAGFVPNRTPSSRLSRVGTYYGQASDDYREVNAGQEIGTYGIPGTERGFANGRINYFFKFEGPSFNVDTACSSGLAAVQAACSALLSGDADTVIAGGLNVITSPDIYCMLGQGHFLSTTGQCKVWDAGADGYCRGDGVGSVVIKRLDDALADNDRILACVLAGATNHSTESISITQPHAVAQKENYRQVMNQAGVNPLDVSFVELHGTGTQVGDAVESESVIDFFAPAGARSTPDKRLHLGAVKSNIGHGEAAAGIASLIKVLLMYRNNTIPPHIGIKTTMNPVVANRIADRNAGVLFEEGSWLPTAAMKHRYSVVNSFGAHGGNTTLLLEDAPSSDFASGDTSLSSSEVVCVSAKSRASLRANVKALLAYLRTNQDARLRDIAYTTGARRIHHHIRLATSVSSSKELQTFLEAAAEDLDTHAKHVRSAAEKSIMFAFSGQGCLYHGAATQLFQRAPTFRDQVRQLDRIVRRLGYPSVLAIVAGEPADSDSADSAQRKLSSDSGSKDDHDVLAMSDGSGTSTPCEIPISKSPLSSQLAMVVIQIALVQYWALLGIKPTSVVGHSLGEYAAFVAAGVLSAADALFLVGKRAELMLKHCEPDSHVMLSIRGATIGRIHETCQENKTQIPFEVSCLNGTTDIVVTGLHQDMVSLCSLMQASGFRSCTLDLPFAFHSQQMVPIINQYEEAARYVKFKDPQIPIVSPLLKKVVRESHVITSKYVARATREPVDFVSALDVALADGVVSDKTVWIEIGPHPVSTTFASAHYGSAKTQTFPSLRRGDETLSAFTGTLAALHCLGLPLNWNEYYDLNEQPARLLDLHLYQWNNKNYWLQYEGSWTLDKAHAGRANNAKERSAPVSSFSTSSVQRIVFEEYGESTGHLTAISDLHHPDLRAAADGHKLNGRSVVTGSIWGDVALTVGEYLYKRIKHGNELPQMNVQNMEVTGSQIFNPGTNSQLIQIEATLDIAQLKTSVLLYGSRPDGTLNLEVPFATAVVSYEDANAQHGDWQLSSHLVISRAEYLWEASTKDCSKVSVLSKAVTYHLFGNVVDYAQQYRGMQRVAYSENTLEATADIVLSEDRHGNWHTPPHWIDSTFQTAGLVMNSFGDKNADGKVAGSSRDFFYIMPGWRDFRIFEPLRPGAYTNYVRMFPVSGEPGTYAGDIYLYREDRLVGMCIGIKFKALPRTLMPILFPQIKDGKTKNPLAQVNTKKPGLEKQHTSVQTKPTPAPSVQKLTKPILPPSFEPQRPRQSHEHTIPQNEQTAIPPVTLVTNQPQAEPASVEQPTPEQSPRAVACLKVIAEGTGLDLEDLVGEAAFADLGVDSLMSLALSAKIRSELDIDLQASVFLECPTVQDLVSRLSR